MTAEPNEPLPEETSARAWLIVGLLWVAAFLNYLDRNMILTMRLSVKEAIPMTDAQFGLLTSVFLWVYAGLSPFAGYLADRFNRSRIIIGSLLVWSLMTWLTAYATTFSQLLTARAIMGISEACYLPAALALIVDFHRGRTRSRAMAFHLTGFMVGSATGGLGGWLADQRGWGYAFVLFGCIGVAHSLLLMGVLRDPPLRVGEVAAPPRFGQAMISLFSSGSFLLLLGVWGLLGLCGWGVAAWLPTYFGELFQLSQGKAGMSSTTVLAGALFIGAIVGGTWADWWGLRHPRGRIFVAMAGLCIAAPGVFLFSAAHTLPLAIVGVFLYGARNFTDTNIMPILCLVIDPRYRATAFGVLNLMACAIGGAAIYAGGALRDAHVNVRHIFEFSAAGLLLSAVLLWFVKPTPGNPDK